MTRKKSATIICIILTFQLAFVSVAQAAMIGGKNITSQGACVMDFDTGKVLYEHNGNVPKVPASMTKIMTVYCVYDAIRSGKISLDTAVPISKNVYDKARTPEYQSVALYYDTKYTVDEMLAIVITYSACAPAVALAELVSGSEEEFVKLMNATAKKMQIDAVYYDCFGVKNNKISPVAMVTLARNLIKEFPEVLSRTSKKSIVFHGSTYYSTNKLFGSYYYEGADGLKTGTTTASGYCFCGTAIRNGRRILAVTMASASSDKRFEDMVTMLDYGFSVKAEIDPVINFSDTITTINGYEMPTFEYKDSKSTYPVVIAEDLQNYGFDMDYYDESRTLTLTFNASKNVNPLDANQHKSKSGMKAFDIVKSNIKVVVNSGDMSYCLKNSYNINGYMCIAVDEFKNFCSPSWENENKSDIVNIAE